MKNNFIKSIRRTAGSVVSNETLHQMLISHDDVKEVVMWERMLKDYVPVSLNRGVGELIPEDEYSSLEIKTYNGDVYLNHLDGGWIYREYK